MHFWLGLVGILLYVAAMWVSGITQGVMLLGTDNEGTVLAYPNFLDTLNAIRPMMLFRVIGGALYLTGFFMMGYNLYRTIRSGAPHNGTIEVAREDDNHHPGRMSFLGGIFNAPVAYSFLLILFSVTWLLADGFVMLLATFGTILTVLVAVVHFRATGAKRSEWYEKLLAHSLAFTVLTIVAVVIGGAVQIIPTVVMNRAASVEERLQVPYTPLELIGRDLYVSEGCYNCHSQMIRTLVPEVMRYGPRDDQGYSRLGESIYDFPFQWGSKRTGPDLARVGGKYNHNWHYRHFMNPRDTSQGSNMPAYPWLEKKDFDLDSLPSKWRVQRLLGVPYEDLSADELEAWTMEQARGIVRELRESGSYVAPEKQIVALIAYIQKLGAYRDLADGQQAFGPDSAPAAGEPSL
jgi:cytochrome c oxidase cbb3-type subunit I/II